MALTIAHIESILKSHSAPESIPDGGMFIHYQSYAVFDLARGWLINAPHSAAIAFDILRRGEMATNNTSPDEVQRESDLLEERAKEALRQDDSTLCRSSAGFLVALAHIDDKRFKASDPHESDLGMIASFRWAKLYVASLIIEREGCPEIDLRPGMTEWAEELVTRTSSDLPDTPLGREAADTIAMWEWAKQEELAHLRSLLAVRAAAFTEMSRLERDGEPGPSLEAVAALANGTFEENPSGISGWTYSAGTMAYDHAADIHAYGISDPVGTVKAAVFFAAASQDPWTSYVKVMENGESM